MSAVCILVTNVHPSYFRIPFLLLHLFGCVGPMENGKLKRKQKTETETENGNGNGKLVMSARALARGHVY